MGEEGRRKVGNGERSWRWGEESSALDEVGQRIVRAVVVKLLQGWGGVD
jgi:hypothetical protein